MSQHDFDIANANGASVRADVNAALQALASNSSGATAPSTTFAYQLWMDTTTGILKIRNGANNAWLNLSQALQQNLVAVGTISGTNTYTATATPTLLSYTDQMLIIGKFTNANTLASTLNIDGIGAKALVDGAGVALASGYVPAGAIALMLYNAASNEVRIISVYTNTLQAKEKVIFSSIITPAQITADQNDYAPSGLTTCSTLRVSSDAARNITGLSAAETGRILILHNVGSFNIVLKNESTSSTAANRFYGSADVTIGSNQCAVLQYDGTTSRWRVLSSPYTATGLDAVTTKTANYTATTADNVIFCDATSGAVTITLYAASGNAGRKLTIKKTDISTNQVIIDGNGSETIDGSLARYLRAQWSSLTIECDGTNWQVVSNGSVRVGAATTISNKTIGTTYQWTGGDGWVTFYVSTASNVTTICTMILKVGASSTPTEIVSTAFLYGHANANWSTGQFVTLSAFIRNGEYYTISKTIVVGSDPGPSVQDAYFKPLEVATQ